ncbi:hypothetical protein QR680_002293 [Steinernema hermaphroditum]|uniref:NAD-dependent protein deacetylase sir-2.1 n=1 Tax=Steinernema hermaphroditum TaxID=289476 RepID=A0AA39LHZ2_9BILA|nr:hypothetical protein QR680_002293 [Steinernema hermaphroditum]
MEQFGGLTCNVISGFIMAKEKLNHSTSEGPQDLREETEQFNHEGWQMAARRVLRSYLPSSFNLDAMTDEQVVDLFYEFVGKPEIRERLPQYATLQDAVELIRKAKNIIVVSGAGVSVSCGIPDFRSENGVYARLRKDFPELPNPEAMFDIDFFRKNPKPFYQFAKELYPGNFNPSISHRFIKILEEQGKLLRNYTQNIDTLESIAGVKNVIECHGSFRTATCLNCGQNFGCDDIRDDVLAKKVAQCAVCGLGVVKPDIVFFGESLPELFHRSIDTDKDVADLLIVMGSSMKVQPVGLVPTSLPPEVPQILINRETLNCRSEFDVQLLGNCDIIVSHLCSLLGGRFKEQIQQEAKVDCDLTPIDAETFHNAVQQHTSHDTSFEGPAAKRPRLPELVTVGDVLKGTYVTAEPNATMFEGARTLYDTDAKAFIFNVSSASSSTTSVCSSDVIDVTSRCVSEPPRGNSQPQKYSRSVSAPPEFNNYDDDDALSTSSSPSTNSTITASSTASAGVQELQSSSTEAINHAQKDDAETFVVSQIHDENDDVISPSSICTSVPSSPRSDTDILYLN